VPKHGAPRLRGNRWVVVAIAAIVLGLAIVWALFVPIADWLAHHDVGSVKGLLHETTVDNVRGRLLTLGAGLFAAAALVFTARNFTLSRRTFELTEQGQVTDRYTKAIEQLGSEKPDVRIGGIYALERVARDSARDHPTVMEVLAAFIRKHSHEPSPLPDSGDREQEGLAQPDVQAAMTVILRRDRGHDIRRINLVDANLTGVFHMGASDLALADLADALLVHADLTGTDLTNANLTNAWLGGAHLTDAHLSGADLTRADLTDANLIGAWLTGAHLVGADLTRADLTDAHLDGADFTRADLIWTRWPAGAPVPEGWKLDPGSGRLERAITGSGPLKAD